jgi:hypothetical protein
MDIISAARAAQKEKEGVRVPVRFPSDLIARVRQCAADLNEPLGDWVNTACRAWMSGRFDGVVTAENKELATRENSEVITVKAPKEMKCEDIKKAALACCMRYEQKRIVYTPQHCANYRVEEFK